MRRLIRGSRSPRSVPVLVHVLVHVHVFVPAAARAAARRGSVYEYVYEYEYGVGGERLDTPYAMATGRSNMPGAVAVWRASGALCRCPR